MLADRAQTGEPGCSPLLDIADPLAPTHDTEAGDLESLTSVAVAPIADEHGAVGMLAIFGDHARRFSEAECNSLERIARALVPSLRDSGSKPSRPAGLTDPVTGLPNGHYLVLEYTQNRVREVDTKGKEVWF